jgi:hypothetical protein
MTSRSSEDTAITSTRPPLGTEAGPGVVDPSERSDFWDVPGEGRAPREVLASPDFAVPGLLNQSNFELQGLSVAQDLERECVADLLEACLRDVVLVAQDRLAFSSHNDVSSPQARAVAGPSSVGTLNHCSCISGCLRDGLFQVRDGEAQPALGLALTGGALYRRVEGGFAAGDD